MVKYFYPRDYPVNGLKNRPNDCSAQFETHNNYLSVILRDFIANAAGILALCSETRDTGGSSVRIRIAKGQEVVFRFDPLVNRLDEPTRIRLRRRLIANVPVQIRVPRFEPDGVLAE